MFGELYVVTFDNGVTKVGRTDDFARRYDEHRRDAARFGLTIANWWRSDQVEQVRYRENRLLARMAEIGIRAAAGREYFQDVPFSIAVAAAERSLAGVCPTCEFHLSCKGVFHVAATMTGVPRIESRPGTVDLVVCDLELACGSVITAVLDNDDLHPGGPTPILTGRPSMVILADFRSRHRAGIAPWTIWGAS
jgi:hypothetical protein